MDNSSISFIVLLIIKIYKSNLLNESILA